MSDDTLKKFIKRLQNAQEPAVTPLLTEFVSVDVRRESDGSLLVRFRSEEGFEIHAPMTPRVAFLLADTLLTFVRPESDKGAH